MEFLAMQSRTPDKIIPTRRSSAWKCGSHSTGNVGSILIDSFSNCDNDFGPFWNLFGKINTLNWKFPRNQFQSYRIAVFSKIREKTGQHFVDSNKCVH